MDDIGNIVNGGEMVSGIVHQELWINEVKFDYSLLYEIRLGFSQTASLYYRIIYQIMKEVI